MRTLRPVRSLESLKATERKNVEKTHPNLPYEESGEEQDHGGPLGEDCENSHKQPGTSDLGGSLLFRTKKARRKHQRLSEIPKSPLRSKKRRHSNKLPAPSRKKFKNAKDVAITKNQSDDAVGSAEATLPRTQKTTSCSPRGYRFAIQPGAIFSLGFAAFHAQR